MVQRDYRCFRGDMAVWCSSGGGRPAARRPAKAPRSRPSAAAAAQRQPLDGARARPGGHVEGGERERTPSKQPLPLKWRGFALTLCERSRINEAGLQGRPGGTPKRPRLCMPLNCVCKYGGMRPTQTEAPRRECLRAEREYARCRSIVQGEQSRLKPGKAFPPLGMNPRGFHGLKPRFL